MNNLKLACDAASIVADALSTKNLDFKEFTVYCKNSFPKEVAEHIIRVVELVRNSKN